LPYEFEGINNKAAGYTGSKNNIVVRLTNPLVQPRWFAITPSLLTGAVNEKVVNQEME
jgi:hypothetical protein